METSLTQQRQTIRRQRVVGIVMIAFAGVGLALRVALFVLGSGSDVASWLVTAFLAVILVLGVERILTSRRKLAEFDRAHGAPPAGT